MEEKVFSRDLLTEVCSYCTFLSGKRPQSYPKFIFRLGVLSQAVSPQCELSMLFLSCKKNSEMQTSMGNAGASQEGVQLRVTSSPTCSG